MNSKPACFAVVLLSSCPTTAGTHLTVWADVTALKKNTRELPSDYCEYGRMKHTTSFFNMYCCGRVIRTGPYARPYIPPTHFRPSCVILGWLTQCTVSFIFDKLRNDACSWVVIWHTPFWQYLTNLSSNWMCILCVSCCRYNCGLLNWFNDWGGYRIHFPYLSKYHLKKKKNKKKSETYWKHNKLINPIAISPLIWKQKS